MSKSRFRNANEENVTEVRIKDERISTTDPIIVEEIKRKIVEGYKAISQEENVVLVVGNTGAGKSTLVNYLAGSKLVAEQVGRLKKLLITVPEPISSKMQVSHKSVSETSIPNSWKDGDNNIVYWDCPGFEDNRGAIQDVANAFYIKKLFESSTNLKIVAVTTEHSFTESRGVEFINLISSLANLFANTTDFSQGLSLIVTKAREDSTPEDIKETIKEILEDQVNGFTNKQKEVLEYLADHENQIALFNAPKKLGEISSVDKDQILSVIANTQSVNKSAVNISISDKSKLCINDLVRAINNQIVDDISHFCKKINQQLKHLVANAAGLEEAALATKELKRFGDEVSVIANEIDITSQELVDKMKQQKIVPTDLLQKIAENIQYLGFCNQVAPESKKELFTGTWLSPWQWLEKGINGNGGYIDSMSGYIKNIIYQNIDQSIEEFSARIVQQYITMDKGQDVDTYKNLKDYAGTLTFINNELNGQSVDIESIIDYIQRELIDKFHIKTSCLDDIKSHIDILRSLNESAIDQYVNHLRLQFSGLDLSKTYQGKIANFEQSSLLKFNNHFDSFIVKLTGDFNNKTLSETKKLQNEFALFVEQLKLKQDISIEDILTNLQEFTANNQELEQAKRAFATLTSLVENNITDTLLSKDEIVKKLFYANDQIEAVYNNYSYKKAEEFNKDINKNTQDFILKVQKAYNNLVRTDDPNKKLLVNTLIENAQLSLDNNLVESINHIKSKLDGLLNLDDIKRIENILNQSQALADQELVFRGNDWHKEISILVEEIKQDVKKDLTAEKAKNRIKVLVGDIEDYTQKVVEKSSDIKIIQERLEKLKLLVPEIIDKSGGKTVSEFVHIVQETIGHEFGDSRRTILEQNLVKINKAANLIIDEAILADFYRLQAKVQEEIDWYHELPKIHKALLNPEFLLSPKVESYNFIDHNNFTKFLQEVTKSKLSFKHDLNKASQLNSLIEANLKSHLSITTSEDQKTVSINGNCVKMSNIQQYVTENTKALKIKCLSTIIFDQDFTAKGADVVIIAPQWLASKNVTIDLAGREGRDHSIAQASSGQGYKSKTREGQEGKDGLPGLPGDNGGNFYGFGHELLRLQKLRIDVSGGKGANGQNGGDGADGQDNNRHANQGKYDYKEVYERQGVVHKYWELKNRGEADCKFYYNQEEYYYGFPGGKGGNSGKGGASGLGGLEGKVAIFRDNILESVKFIADTGKSGEPGNSGSPGNGGRNSNDLAIYTGMAPSDPNLRKASYSIKTGHFRRSNEVAEDGDDSLEKNGSLEQLQREPENKLKMIIAEAKQEFLLLQNNPAGEKFYFKVQKPYLESFVNKLSLSGQGLDEENLDKTAVNYITELNKYFDQGIDQLLDLRVKYLPEKPVNLAILPAKYLFTASATNMSETMLFDDVTKAFAEGKETILVPYNLYGKHWSGMIIEKMVHDIKITYLDSENNLAPEKLVNPLVERLNNCGYVTKFAQEETEQQIANNCGPELIENFMLHLTKVRVPQEKTVAFHMQLFEEELMNVNNDLSVTLLLGNTYSTESEYTT